MGLFDFFSTDIAIDLGTANTLIYIKGKGIVLNEPSIVAFDKNSKRIIALGNKAKEMQGREHKEIRVTRPMRDGVIADFEIAEGMIRAFIKRVRAGVLSSRRIVVAVPSGVTEVEKRAVRDSAEHAGAKEVHLIAEPMSAAIGIGIDVDAPVGNMIIDIGGGTTEIAVIALSGIVNEESIRIAGDEMNYAIMQFFKRNHNTKTTEVGSAEIREALNECIVQIIDAVRQTLERTPPELSADILDRGVMLTGGGALLKGLDERIRMETNLPVHVADDPLTAVVRGTGKVIDNLNDFSKVLIRNRRY
ncbi:MAG: rod shape-determining protein [Ignavibacteriaceae bacterium]